VIVVVDVDVNGDGDGDERLPAQPRQHRDDARYELGRAQAELRGTFVAVAVHVAVNDHVHDDGDYSR
jgi:hypothetical protein